MERDDYYVGPNPCGGTNNLVLAESQESVGAGAVKSSGQGIQWRRRLDWFVPESLSNLPIV